MDLLGQAQSLNGKLIHLALYFENLLHFGAGFFISAGQLSEFYCQAERSRSPCFDSAILILLGILKIRYIFEEIFSYFYFEFVLLKI